MPSSKQCQRCAAELGADAPEGLCPRCLLAPAWTGADSAGVAGADETLAASSDSGSPRISDAVSARQPAAGERVRYFGDYELVEEIAHGGMGVVYKARQGSLNRIVALKMILAGHLASVAEEQRFRAEAEAAANLDHPNIVPLYEVGEHEGRHYFTMKLLDGGSLAESMSRDRKVYTETPRAAAQLMSIVAGAVHYAHQRGILHRDLKPANVLLDHGGSPYVADFGLAKRLDGGPGVENPAMRTAGYDMTVSGTVVGTPAYMAPEQARGQTRQVSVATDVYGIGAILYHLLTGRPPFEGESIVEILRDVVEKEPLRPQSVNPKIDRDLETVCLKAMAKEPARRYASAGALKEDLDHWLAGEPILARRVGSLERGVKWARRRPAVAALLAMVAITLVVGMAMVTWQWRRAERLRGIAETQRQIAERQTELTEAQRRQAETERGIAETQRGIAESQRLVAETERRRGDDENLRQRRALAGLALERGINYCEHNDIPRGVLWMARALETSGSDNPDFEWDARVNLSAWLPRLHALQHILAQPRTVNDAWDRMEKNLACMAYTRDGARLVVVGENTAQVWDTSTGKRIGYPFAPAYGKFPVAIAPDALTVYTSHPGGLRAYDTATQKLISEQHFDGLENANAMIVSPNGARLIASCLEKKKGVIRMWELASGKRVGADLRGDDAARCLAICDNGSRLVAGHSKGAMLWDLSVDPPVGKFVAQDDVQSVAIQPDGSAFATGNNWGSGVHMWNATTLARGPGVPYSNRVLSVSYSPDGKLLATASHDYTVRVWNADTGKAVGVPLFHGGWMYRVAFSPDSKTMAAFSGLTVHLWRLAEPAKEISLPHKSGGIAIAYSVDGRHVVTGGNDKMARVWDADTGEPLSSPLEHDNNLFVAQFTADGRKIITGDATHNMYIWDWAAGKLEKKVHLEKTKEDLWAMALSPDRSKVLVGQKSHQAGVWDIVTGKPVAEPWEVGNGQWTVAWSPDASTLAVGTWSSQVMLFDATTMKPTGRGYRVNGAVGGLAFSPDSSKLLAGAFAEKLARVLDVRTCSPIGPAMEQSEVSVRGGAYAPDGKSVAVASGGIVRIFDPYTGKLLGPALQNPGDVRGIAYSSDGRHIALATGSGGRIYSVAAPIAGEAAEVRRRVEAATGHRLDGDTVRILNYAEWKQEQQPTTQPSGAMP